MTAIEPVEANKKSPLLGRIFSFASWIVPSAILALLPKCPACVVGYVVIGTSVGSSIAGQAQLRMFLIIVAVVCFSYAGFRSLTYAVTRLARRAH